MTEQDIIRAWKDEAFFLSLGAEERACLPENPVGLIELSTEDVLKTEDGFWTFLGCTLDCTFGSCVTICVPQSAVTFCPQEPSTVN